MARACSDSWLDTFMKWTKPRSEAPESFLEWAGLFTLASVAKRHVCFPKRLMGSYEIVPNLYVLFVAPPGVARKSTTAGYGEVLLKQVDGVKLASTAMSKSQLIEVMSNIKDGSITILSSEFSNFINVSREEMYDYLTDVYDGKAKYEYDTRTWGKETVEKPCINLLAATIPDWINQQAPEHITGGGFSSRVIFIYEEARRRHMLYYDKIDEEETKLLESMLVKDLRHIALLTGEFAHSDDGVKDEMEAWYRKSSESFEGDERTMGYHNRRHVHLHKLAMLLSLARNDNLIITTDDFRQAKKILSRAEARMPQALANVGRNPLARYMDEIVTYVKTKEDAVPLGQIQRRFAHNLRKDETAEVLSTLVIMGRLKTTRENDVPFYL